MKIALVRPPAPERSYLSQEALIPTLGIGYVASYLRSRGAKPIIIDGIIERLTPRHVVDRVLNEKVAIVGISAMTPEIDAAYSLAETIKTADAGIVTLIGGVHAIALPARTMEECTALDFLIAGEGEVSAWELYRCLCEGNSPHDIEGVVWRRNAHVVANASRPLLRELDQLPFPAWDLYPTRVPCYFILSSRGCSFRCTFCMRALGDRVRYRSCENIVEEIEWLIRRLHPKRLIFQDETFTLNRQRTETLLDLMIGHGIPHKLRWVIQTRVDMVDKALLRHLRMAGCVRIEFGIESGNPDILKRTQKGINLTQAQEAVATAKKEGLFVSCSFIFGHPRDTKETIRDTIRFCQKLNPHNATFGIMVPYPNTVIASLVENRQEGYVRGPNSWRDFTRFSMSGVELENLTYRDMEKLQLEAYLRYFLCNMRLVALMHYVWSHRVQVMTFLQKFFRSSLHT